MNIVKTYPLTNRLNPKIAIPSSKPETQRAILVGSLACGESRVYNYLNCLETATMIQACRSIGANIEEEDKVLMIEGIRSLEEMDNNTVTIDCLESGLVARIFLAVGSSISRPIHITGGKVLTKRILAPLTSSLLKAGVDIEFLKETGHLPLINKSTYLPGGIFSLPGNISSQFVSSLLLAAPLARDRIQIQVAKPIYSESYIKQTLAIMKEAGILVEYLEDFSSFEVTPNEYNPLDISIYGDYTSASYFLAKAILFPGTTVLKNITEISQQGEKEMVDLIKSIGINAVFDSSLNELRIENNLSELEGEIEFDARNCPNIIPTLAAIGAFVKGRLRVTGGLLTNYHKSPRIEVILSELCKLDVRCEPIYCNNLLDGFEIYGKASYQGGVSLSSWGDHRIFMSLFLVSLKCLESNYIDGYSSVNCSFPAFLHEFKKQGACYEII